MSRKKSSPQLDQDLSRQSEESFIEDNSDETRPPSTGKIKLTISDGQVDWSAVSDSKKKEALSALAEDSDVLSEIMASGGEVEAEAIVKEEHVKTLLDIYSEIAQLAVPFVIKKKTQGHFTIDRDIAQAAFQFTENQKDKLAPSGADAANQHLPEKARKIIATVGGPAPKFFVDFAIIAKSQLINMLAMQSARNQESQPQNANGVAGERPKVQA